MIDFDEGLIVGQFFQSLRQHGITPRDEFYPIMDGQIHRFVLEGDRYGEKTGAYKFFPITPNDWPVWCIQDFRQGGNMIKCKLDKDLISQDNRTPRMSYDELQRKKAENERKRREEMKLKQENEKSRIDEAFAFWHSDAVKQETENVGLINQHPYMRHKHVILPPNTNCYAGIDQHDNLIFPLYDSLTGHFKTLQFIAPPDSQGHSSKWFFEGISTSGVFYPIRRVKGDTLYITEGIATAFSVNEMYEGKCSVAAAMNCGNLLEVAKNRKSDIDMVRRYNPSFNQKIIIAADNDKNNAGRKAAEKVVEAGYVDGISMPPRVGDDWNDYMNRLKGLIP